MAGRLASQLTRSATWPGQLAGPASRLIFVPPAVVVGTFLPFRLKNIPTTTKNHTKFLKRKGGPRTTAKTEQSTAHARSNVCTGAQICLRTRACVRTRVVARFTCTYARRAHILARVCLAAFCLFVRAFACLCFSVAPECWYACLQVFRIDARLRAVSST